MEDEKKPNTGQHGTDTLESVIIQLVDMGESIAQADKDGDGKIEKGEIMALLFEHGMKMMGIIRKSSEIVEEAKDLQPVEYQSLLNAAVDAIDRLTHAQRAWVKATGTYSIGLSLQIASASKVWKSI